MLVSVEANLVHASHHGRSASGTNWRGDVGSRESHAFGGQAIDVWRLALINGIAVTTHPGRGIFGEQPQDIWLLLFAFLGGGGSTGGENAKYR